MKVCVVGTGYVGLSTAICLAYLGHEVRGFDVNNQKIESLRNGILPIHEPGLPELLHLSGNNLSFSADPAAAITGAEIIIITVGTPSLADRRPDLRYLDSAATMIAPSPIVSAPI